jgi:hypothetical protein
MDTITSNLGPFPVWTISESRFWAVFEDIGFYDDVFQKEQVPILFRETITSDRNP